MIEIPEWLKVLPKNAKVGSKDFAIALGISVRTLDSRIYRCVYDTPKPDGKIRRASPIATRKLGSKNYWKAVTVRNHIRHLNRLELEKSK